MLGSSARAAYRALLPPLLILVLVASSVPVQAQLPENPASGSHYAANVIPEQGSVSLDFQGSATIPLTIEDVSIASNQEPIVRERNTVRLSVDIVGNDTRGWAASVAPPLVQTKPGETHTVNLDIQSGAGVQRSTVEVRIESVYRAVNGDVHRTNASLMAVVDSFPRLAALPAEYPDKFQPDDRKRVGITVTNNDIYPDMAHFRVNAPEEWMVSPPSSVRLGPGESRTVYMDLRAPDNPWFLYTSQSDYITIDVVSENGDRTLVTTGLPVSQSGSTFPGWALPHSFLLLLGAALLTKRTARKVRDRRLAKGKPSYPGLDPEHEAEFEALKIEDADRAETLERRLSTLYDQRKEAWKQAYKARKREEETLEETYRERHEALVAAREGEDDAEPNNERSRRRRRLLERKRELLQRKRERLGGGEPSASGDGASEDDDPSARGRPS